jgi:hypothetical protein
MTKKDETWFILTLKNPPVGLYSAHYIGEGEEVGEGWKLRQICRVFEMATEKGSNTQYIPDFMHLSSKPILIPKSLIGVNRKLDMGEMSDRKIWQLAENSIVGARAQLIGIEIAGSPKGPRNDLRP